MKFDKHRKEIWLLVSGQGGIYSEIFSSFKEAEENRSYRNCVDNWKAIKFVEAK